MKSPCVACQIGIDGLPCPPKCIRKVRRELERQKRFDEHGDEMPVRGSDRSKRKRADGAGK